MEDIKCLAGAISDNPDEVRKLYELLGLSDDELDLNEAGTDTIDGAPILRHLTQKKCVPDITYERIATVLVNRRDLVVKYCKGEPLK